MVADRIPNPRREGSIPSTDAFSGIHEYRHEQLTTGHSSHFLPAGSAVRGTSLRRRAYAGEDRPRGRNPRGRHQLWASGQAASFGLRTSGVRVPPAGPGARGMLATGRAGAGNVPCDGNPHHIRRRAPDARGSTGQSACLRSRRVQVQVLPGVLCPRRKWAMRRDVTPEEAGSSPAGHPRSTCTTTIRHRTVRRATRGGCSPYKLPGAIVAVRNRMRLWPNWERRLA